MVGRRLSRQLLLLLNNGVNHARQRHRLHHGRQNADNARNNGVLWSYPQAKNCKTRHCNWIGAAQAITW